METGAGGIRVRNASANAAAHAALFADLAYCPAQVGVKPENPRPRQGRFEGLDHEAHSDQEISQVWEEEEVTLEALSRALSDVVTAATVKKRRYLSRLPFHSPLLAFQSKKQERVVLPAAAFKQNAVDSPAQVISQSHCSLPERHHKLRFFRDLELVHRNGGILLHQLMHGFRPRFKARQDIGDADFCLRSTM